LARFSAPEPPSGDKQATPLLGAALATAISFSILLALGVWQIQRLHWKQGLIAQIDAAERTPPATLTSATPPLFARVQASGTLRPDHLALYGAEVRGMHIGAQAIQLLDRPGEKPLLVMLGWVPTDPTPHPQGGPASITGYVRLPEPPGWLSASDDLQGRHFYSLNPTTIGAALGAANVAPFTLIAMGSAAAPGSPQPATELPRPTNNHLQYAFTWFGLAGSLLGVFCVWAVKRL
jgi:surfeit locus 1 family protein